MLPTRPPRYRTSSSASAAQTTKATEVLQGLLDRLSETLNERSATGYPSIQDIIEEARKLHQHVAVQAPPCSQQDDFRRLRGFQQLLEILRAFSGFYNPQKRTQTEKSDLFDLLHVILAILSTAFRGHPGNRRYFQDRVEDGGWETLEQIIASTGLGGSESDLWTNFQLFGKLLSFALDDQRMDDLCRSLASAAVTEERRTDAPPGQPPDQESEGERTRAQTESSLQECSALELAGFENRLRNLIGSKTVMTNGEIIRTVVGFWESVPRTPKGTLNPVSMFVLISLSLLSEVSFFNLTAIHGSGALSRFLRLAFAKPQVLTDEERDKVLPMCRELMYLGSNRLADTQFLMSCQDPEASEFCLAMAKQYNGPPFIQFDLSLHGQASIELPSLGRLFPPPGSPGYTFAAWIRVDDYDPKSHTTLFGLLDSTRTCFVMAYIENTTHNLILQTSLTSHRPSVRFKTVAFREKRWYHIALVHRKPKAILSSKASLYVDGEFVEQLRAPYPDPPPLSNGSTESFASLSSSTSKTNPVQAFVGTPRDLSSLSGPGLVFSKWSLASAHLIEDVLSDDLLAVYYRLGHRYQGNFQDCLGGFQTYEASAALGLRNEIFHPGKDENSDILRAVREKAGTIVPEHKVAFSLLPRAIFRSHGSFMDTNLFRSLSRSSASSLMYTTTKNGTSVAVNGAVPCINDALIRPNGLGLLSGDPVLSTPFHLDDNLWRLAGFTPLALKMVERASSGDELLRSVELMVNCIEHNWRNSEAMERENGYGILSMLLRAKLGYGSLPADNNASWRLSLTNDERDKLGFQLLGVLLSFVGYQHADPLESFIVNPLAYRVLLIDHDTWRRSASLTQELYYRQFVTFAVQSKYHQFNSRRLLRMRIVKRLLDALKAETISEDMLPHFMTSFESLVKCNFNSEIHRSIALFVTYAFHTPSASSARPRRPSTGTRRSNSPVPAVPGACRRPTLELTGAWSAGTINASRLLSRRQLGVKMLEMYTRLLCERDKLDDVRRFAKTVTNKWLLYLLAEEDPEVVVYGCQIMARLLVTQPLAYCNKFAAKTGGFAIMAHRLKPWWDIRTLWPILFSILFGYDVAKIDFDRPFEFFSLYEIFSKSQIRTAAVVPVITAMLQHGLRDMLKYQDDPASPSADNSFLPKGSTGAPEMGHSRSRARSMELGKALEPRRTQISDRERVNSHAADLKAVVQFLADMQANSQGFRDFALSSDYVRLLLCVLYPVIVSADPVSPETELTSKDSVLNFEGGDVMIRPVPGSSSRATPIVRTSSSTAPSEPLPCAGLGRGTPLRRPSSFILVTSQPPRTPTPARIDRVLSPKKTLAKQQTSNVVLQGLLDLITSVFTDQMLKRKEFPGFGLFLKVPPGFQEHQAYFESYILRHTITQLRNAVEWEQKCLLEPKVLQNMARFSLHMVEAIFEGWFLNGAEAMVDFVGFLLEYLQRPEVAGLKSVRLCSPAVASIRMSFLKLVLLRLSDMDEAQTTETEAAATMAKMLYWQAVLISCLSLEDDFMKLLWYQLYHKLVDGRHQTRLAAASLWRIMLVQKPDESTALLRQCMATDQQTLARSFIRLTEEDDEAFVHWVDEHRPALDLLFFGGMSKTWEDFVHGENQRTNHTATSRLKSRKEKLKQWHAEGGEREMMLARHETCNSAWMKSIYYGEYVKYQRIVQDQQDDKAFLTATFGKMDRDLRRPGAVFAEQQTVKWKLDRTEGRNRMRLRLLPDYAAQQHQDFQPKRRRGESTGNAGTTKAAAATTTSCSSTPVLEAMLPRADLAGAGDASGPHDSSASSGGGGGGGSSSSSSTTTTTSTKEAVDLGADLPGPHPLDHQSVAPEDDFELVEDPKDHEADENFEDKNRKVIRRLQRGDAIQSVFNVSRIIGLDACEGILIVGKESLYMMDNLFQKADGEIVNVWQAPAEERDPFSMIITGGANRSDRGPAHNRSEQDGRHWRWHDVLSISKRRFLFRDVAIELFFTDGRSYLLTTMKDTARDELYSRLASKTPHTSGPHLLANPDDAWRLEGLRFADEASHTFGAKFGSIFTSSGWNPLTKRWQKGEMSNFHYLMLVNTMAGRTFNDLTQYPVFPWVLADYTSEELDLTDARTFRDLSKPMGAQSAGRAADIALKYASMTEMGDQPYHYGTHYSSAMIVCSYLIRLPPFVQSFILMQGGTFDHPDRLFYSVGGAWKSAAGDASTDVRELIPEFFYLPEFLTNINGYNFGHRQGDAGPVNDVILPPWAKGDAKIFIAKHREALESPHVSQKLHQWIDLVFGCKQQGEPAVEALNLFHPYSYRGTRDLDDIQDAQERAVVTNIVHNFGQTPQQVFTRPHAPRELDRSPVRRLDGATVHALTRLPHPLLESGERVASLLYAPKLDRLLCASPFRLNLPPHYDRFLEWGYADNSVRFFASDAGRRPAGVFENLHIGQLSTLTFADSKTLVTAGEDCVVSVYSVHAPAPVSGAAAGAASLAGVGGTGLGGLGGLGGGAVRPVELVPRSSLFGHKTPVTTMAVSKVLSTLLTVSGRDGTAFLWDLNRLELVRRLPLGNSSAGRGGGVECARIHDGTGDIMLCSGATVALYTLNGALLLEQNVCGAGENDGGTGAEDDVVQCCAFYEGAGGSEWCADVLVFTGHKRGRVKVWRKAVGRDGRWCLEFLRRLDHADPRRSETGANVEAAITCIAPMPQLVYTGDEDGRVWEWNLIQRER